MNEQQQSLDTLRDIKSMMERSSRFISLSGLSGVSAGLCALAGSWLAYPVIYEAGAPYLNGRGDYDPGSGDLFQTLTHSRLFWIAVCTLVAAILLAFLFTWVKSSRDNIPVWGKTSRRLIISVSVPMFIGAVFMLNLLSRGELELISPACLLFYGLGLISASKYTFAEIGYLGYLQLLLGLLNLGYPEYGLYFWAIGFGALHIIYGIYMWLKYDRKNINETQE